MKKCRQQQIFDSDLKGAWHYNHVTFTPIAKNYMLYCRLIYMLSILCVRLTIKVKVVIPESFKVGWYPPKKLGRVTLTARKILPLLDLLAKFQRVLACSCSPSFCVARKLSKQIFYFCSCSQKNRSARHARKDHSSPLLLASQW